MAKHLQDAVERKGVESFGTSKISLRKIQIEEEKAGDVSAMELELRSSSRAGNYYLPMARDTIWKQNLRKTAEAASQ